MVVNNTTASDRSKSLSAPSSAFMASNKISATSPTSVGHGGQGNVVHVTVDILPEAYFDDTIFGDGHESGCR